MNDSQRLDWLERNPDRLLAHHRADDTHKFSIMVEKARPLPDPNRHKWANPTYSQEYDTLREALDEGMKQIL